MGIEKIKLAILISGRGSNMCALIDACQTPDFPAAVSVVLSNQPDAAGLAYAQEHGIPTEIVDHTAFASRKDFEAALYKRIQPYNVDLVVLAGFMRILTASFIEKWPDRIINIHPSLLPDYKGLHTHARALADGRTHAGCTVHYVIPEMDSGEIILQKKVPILSGDTPDTLAARVLEQEHIAYPEAVKIVASRLKKP